MVLRVVLAASLRYPRRTSIPLRALYPRFMATANEWSRVDATSEIPTYSLFTKPIKKSPQDTRDYRLIKLENGLQALLVHDAKADKAAASLNVCVGHLSDPDDMHGMAHFCEHLLFMGTSLYPVENEYSEYLSKNNGGSNAFTGITNTNYHFSVATSALPGALARFAAFFHCPLFAPSCTSRELNAVDSEHKKNHQNDMWRIYQVNKHLSKEGHVWRKFGTGHRDSLSKAAHDLLAQGKLEHTRATLKGNGYTSGASSLAPSQAPSRVPSPALSSASKSSEYDDDGGAIGRETRRRLVEWWENNYCAGRMQLCVVGKESLDELSSLTSTLFSPILNRGYEPLQTFPDHPFGPDEKGTLISIQTIMEFYALEISFPLEWQAPLWQLKPGSFLAHLIGHEGPGSLHSYLKNKHWITDLSAGPQSLGRGFDMYRITIQMTEEGFSNYKSILLATFRYLSMLRESQFPNYLQDERVILDDIRFRFKEKTRPDEYAISLSQRLPQPPPKELVLAAGSLTFSWNEYPDPEAGEKKVREYLDSFRIQGGRAVLMARAKAFEKLDNHQGAQWDAEPWYGAFYRVERFDPEFVKKADESNDIPELHLPRPNEFVPKNLEVDKKEVAEPLTRPHLIHQTPLVSVWHKKDDQFWIPRAYTIVDIRSPFANESARASLMNRLFSGLVNDALTEYSYDASLAGLSYNFANHPGGIVITMSGYNDKMSVLVQHVLEKAKTLVVDPERLTVIKEEVKRSLNNFFMGESYSLSDFHVRYLLTDRAWTVEEKLDQLDSITASEVQQFIAKLLSEVKIRILVNGNMFRDEAVVLSKIIEQDLKPTSVSDKKLWENAMLLPEGTNSTWISTITNPNQPNSAVSYFVQYGSNRDPHLRVKASLLTQILREPSFDTLRTKEQLGYIVFCTGWTLPNGNEQGLRMIIQSEKTPGYCESRIEAFFKIMKTRLEEMPDDVFQEHKSGLQKKWTEAYKNLSEETNSFYAFLDSNHLDFLRNKNDAKLLDEITKEDIVSMFMTKVHPSSKTRAKLSVHMVSQKPRSPRISLEAAEAFEALVREANLGVDETAWRNALGEPPFEAAALGKFWLQLLGDRKGKEALLAAIPGLLKQFPVEGEGDNLKQPDIHYIHDTATFRASLMPSADRRPLVEWGDLPVSKF